MATSKLEIIINGRDNASGILGKFGSALGGVAKIAGGIIGAKLFLNLASGIKTAGLEALESYAGYERLGMSLDSLVAKELLITGQSETMADAMGSAGTRAEELLEWIENLAIKSPFQQESIEKTFQTALGYGMVSDMAQDMTEALINYSAATGKGEDETKMLGLALGQVWAKGKLTGEEMRQLTNAGLGVADVSRAMGIEVEDLADQMKKGKISAEELIPALIAMIDADFGGAAEKQATSWAGLLSTFEDIKSIGLRKFFEGTFKAVQPYVQSFVDTISSPEFMDRLTEIGNEVGAFITDMIGGFQDAKKAVQPFIDALQKGDFKAIFGDNVGTAIEEVLASVGKLSTAFTEKWPIMQAGAQIFWDFLINLYNTSLAQIISNVGSILDSIAVFWQAHGDKVIMFVTTAFQLITVTISSALNWITGLVAAAMQILQGNWQGAWMIMQNTISTILSSILAIVGMKLSEFLGIWQGVWDNINLIVNTIMGNVSDFLIEKLDEINEFIDEKINAAKDIFAGAFDAINSAIDGTMSWIDKIIEKAQALYDWLEEHIFSFHINIPSLPDWVQDLVGGSGGGGEGDSPEGNALGTSGWQTVPPGYPNDSYPIGLTSGEHYFVARSGQSAPGGSGGGNVININVSGAGDPRAVAQHLMTLLKLQGVRL